MYLQPIIDLLENVVYTQRHGTLVSAYICSKYSRKLWPNDASQNHRLSDWCWTEWTVANMLKLEFFWEFVARGTFHYLYLHIHISLSVPLPLFWYISNELKYENCFFCRSFTIQLGQVENYHRRNRNKRWRKKWHDGEYEVKKTARMLIKISNEHLENMSLFKS